MRTGSSAFRVAGTHPGRHPLLGVGRELLGEADQALAL